jgi:hypothetical protein
MTQELHVVLGGELVDLDGTEFRDPSKIHYVGVFPNRPAAVAAWRGNAQQTVDNALMRYFVLPLHELLEHLHPMEHH